jgi:heme oxygenase (biliverdin-producing, ferredoxin)
VTETLAAELDLLETEVRETLENAGCTPLIVPDQFQLETDYKGSPFRLSSQAFRSESFVFGRTVRVDAGAFMQVFNGVLFPRGGTHSSIIGCEILAFQKGVHLFVLDTFGQTQRPDPVLYEMARTRQDLMQAYPLEPTPQWGNNIFSEHVVIIKPPLGTPLDQTLVKAFKTVLGVAVRCQQKSTAVDNSRRQLYLAEHASGEPARPFLARVAGTDWAEQFISEFLFPRWLDVDRAPPWPRKTLTEQLRKSTRTHHHAIESGALASSLLKGSLPLSAFRLLLACYRLIWTALEDEFQKEKNPVAPAWTADMRKVPLLDHDLAQLDSLDASFAELQSPALVSAQLMAKALNKGHPGQLLGTLYVLEGSTLGGVILHRNLRVRTDLKGSLRYYMPYGGKAGSHWKDFCHRLNALPAKEEDVVDGACWAFDRLKGMFDQIHPGRSGTLE